jgi:hypothetical protein
MSPTTVVAYRVGDCYVLESDEPGAEPVTLVLAEGVRIGRSNRGELLLYRDYLPFGMRLEVAMEQSWCWVQEPDEQGRADG